MDRPSSDSATPRQQQVLDCTWELIREAGLSGVTVRRVAERVGFSEAALYRHFPSKQALLLALLDRLADRLLEPLDRIARQDSPAAERLRQILFHHVGVVLESEGLAILLLGEASAMADQEMVERIRRVVSRYLDRVEEVAALLPPDPGGPSARELALLLLGLPAALAIHHRLFADRRLERRAQEALVPFVVERLSRAHRAEG